MIEAPDVKPWLFLIKPYEGESLSHFLGRFRRANHLSASGLGTLAGIGAIVARWERFHFNPRPSQQELEAIASVVEVDAQRLAQMLPPAGVGMQHEPIRCVGLVMPSRLVTELNGSTSRCGSAIAINSRF